MGVSIRRNGSRRYSEKFNRDGGDTGDRKRILAMELKLTQVWKPPSLPSPLSLSYCFMQETDLSVKAEINLYYDLHVPDDHASPAPLLVAVHGYGAHKRYMMREAKLVAPESFVI